MQVTICVWSVTEINLQVGAGTYNVSHMCPSSPDTNLGRFIYVRARVGAIQPCANDLQLERVENLE